SRSIRWWRRITMDTNGDKDGGKSDSESYLSDTTEESLPDLPLVEDIMKRLASSQSTPLSVAKRPSARAGTQPHTVSSRAPTIVENGGKIVENGGTIVENGSKDIDEEPTIRKFYAHGAIVNTDYSRLAEEWVPQVNDIVQLTGAKLIQLVKDWGWSKGTMMVVRNSSLTGKEPYGKLTACTPGVTRAESVNASSGLTLPARQVVCPAWRISKILSLEHIGHEPERPKRVARISEVIAKAIQEHPEHRTGRIGTSLPLKRREERLHRLFWMHSDQVRLYRRYHDVVVHDNTCKTNRMGMSLTCFVVVDSTFRTRLVACALGRHETQEYYAWGLRQFLSATKQEDEEGFLYPKTIIMDEEAAMEAAIGQELDGKTNIVSCSRHMDRNIRSKIQRRLPSDDGDAFMRMFELARESITEDSFRMIWKDLCQKFGGNGKEERCQPENVNNGNQAERGDQPVDRDDHLFAEYEWGSMGVYLRRMRRRRDDT
ncbi:hypothetical protein BGZ94_003187, partial [Podila epigama]